MQHREMIIAWANGAKIQHRCPGNMKDYWEDVERPDWFPTWEYRVKPEAEFVTLERNITFDPVTRGLNFGDSRFSTIRITFDTDTCLPVDVELL